MEAENIIIRPVVTEKSTNYREKQNVYVFIVSRDANKIQIKKAINDLFNVDPLSVNTLNIKGKLKRVRYKYGYTSSYKKAYIKLKDGDKIAIFEGA